MFSQLNKKAFNQPFIKRIKNSIKSELVFKIEVSQIKLRLLKKMKLNDIKHVILLFVN